jgi:hypothetical protein
LKSAGANGKCAAVRTLEQTLMVQRLEILTNGNQRRAEALGEIANEDAAIHAQHFQNFATAFLAEQANSPDYQRFRFVSFDSGRLSRFSQASKGNDVQP